MVSLFYTSYIYRISNFLILLGNSNIAFKESGVSMVIFKFMSPNFVGKIIVLKDAENIQYNIPKNQRKMFCFQKRTVTFLPSSRGTKF